MESKCNTPMESVRLESLSNCKLIIGNYPAFQYDALGGGGVASLNMSETEHLYSVAFKPSEFKIPPLNYKTTKLYGIPILPGIEIKMFLDTLNGTINKKDGEILLQFESRFVLNLFSLTYFPPLSVKTVLCTNKVEQGLFKAIGKPLDRKGKSTLVGIATIPPTGNFFLDLFLGLPNEAFALLNCNITF